MCIFQNIYLGNSGKKYRDTAVQKYIKKQRLNDTKTQGYRAKIQICKDIELATDLNI